MKTVEFSKKIMAYAYSPLPRQLQNILSSSNNDFREKKSMKFLFFDNRTSSTLSGCDTSGGFPRAALRLPWAILYDPFRVILYRNTLEVGNWIVAQGKRSAALGASQEISHPDKGAG